MAQCHSFYLFINFKTHSNTFVHTYGTVHHIRWGRSRFLHCFRSVEGSPLGCRAGIRTRACRTAGRCTTIWVARTLNKYIGTVLNRAKGIFCETPYKHTVGTYRYRHAVFRIRIRIGSAFRWVRRSRSEYCVKKNSWQGGPKKGEK